VDDDDDLVDALRAVLAHPRVAIESASNGVQALEKARALAPDAVLLDAILPLVSGFEVFASLASGGAPPPRIVFVSGLAEAGALEFAKDLGAFACVRKPFDADSIRRTVLEALAIGES
jgi:CheY-like chemotaxis protein